MSGFTDTSAIIAITADLNLYQNEYERNKINIKIHIKKTVDVHRLFLFFLVMMS